jgi:hypothetical protein
MILDSEVHIENSFTKPTQDMVSDKRSDENENRPAQTYADVIGSFLSLVLTFWLHRRSLY